MALYKVIDSDALDAGMTAVADVIRAKAGLTDPLVWPDGFKSAVESIQSGGGAREPYIEETYDSNGNLIDVNFVGYTAIRPNLFQNCNSLALTSLPSGITSIGNNVFYNCSKLALASLPSGLTRIGSGVFYNCSKLALTSLPSSITSIGNYAFSSCTNLALTNLPSGLTIIKSGAFNGCTGLTSITFKGKPNNINSSAFNGCTNLKTINVPWASGEVANAPWGSTNATINYNYTG